MAESPPTGGPQAIVGMRSKKHQVIRESVLLPQCAVRFREDACNETNVERGMQVTKFASH